MATSITLSPIAGAPTKKDSVAVSKDTHVQIGRFSFVHSLLQEQAALIVVAKKQLQDIFDAEEELILVDDETLIPCQIDSPSLFEKSKADAEAFLEQEKLRLQTDIQGYEAQANEYSREIEELRADLYGKLGNLVQLDNAEEDD